MNSVRSNNLSLKYKRFTPSGCKVIEIRNLSLWQRLNFFTCHGEGFVSRGKLGLKNDEYLKC